MAPHGRERPRNRTGRLPGDPLCVFAGCCAFAVFLLSGCSAEYAGERLFWQAERIKAQLPADPQQVTPPQVAAVVNAYQRVTQRVPGTEWAVKAQEAVGLWYLSLGRYPNARDALTPICRNYDNFPRYCAMSLVSIGRSYEAEQAWDAAVRTYEELSVKYPWTKVWYEAPLYAAQAYERAHDAQRTTAAYQQAIEEYRRRLIMARSDPQRVAQLERHLLLAYEGVGDWAKAAKTLEGLASRAPSADLPELLMRLGRLYHQRLHDAAKADALYARLIAQFPQHPLALEALLVRQRLASRASQ